MLKQEYKNPKSKTPRVCTLGVFVFGPGELTRLIITILLLVRLFFSSDILDWFIIGDWVAAFGGKCFKKACRNKKTNGKRKMDGNSRIILSFPVDYDSMFLEK